jgi:hypothetical protein
MADLAEVIDIEDYTIDQNDFTGNGRPKFIRKPNFVTPVDNIYATASTATSLTTTTSATATSSGTISATIDNPTVKPNISLRELYPLTHELKPELGTALSLLEEGINNIDIAINMIIENKLMISDDAIQRFQALLPELFCCRTLGDGFGAIISAIYNALKNLDGLPANLEQLKVIKKIVTRIQTEPFINFDEAVDEIMLFEAVGLISEPSHFEYAADLLIE